MPANFERAAVVPSLMVIRWSVAATCLALLAALPLAPDSVAKAQELEPAPFAVQKIGTIRDRSLFEASGMAASRRRDGVLWMHNDSGSAPMVFAVASDGRTLARVPVRDATARDWEDMASFEYEGRPMLLVADVGDNEARRGTSWLHVLEEPVLSDAGLPSDTEAQVLWSVPFEYPDGPADTEAVAVDVAAACVLLMTKRQNPPRLYSVPLRAPPVDRRIGRRQVAQLLGEVTTIPRPRAEDLLKDPMVGVYGSQPTAMDLAGDQLLVLTYLNAYVFTRGKDESWAQAVTRAPRIVTLPRMRQGEAIAFDRRGVHAYVSSEKSNAPIYRLARRAEPAAAAPAPASPAQH